MSGTRYIVSGGNGQFVAALVPLLRASEVIRSNRDDGALGERDRSIAAWIHVLPDGQNGALGQVEAVTDVLDRADRVLPEHEGATLVSVAPVFGTLTGETARATELAAAVARSFSQVNIENWSKRGLRINSISYGPIEPASVPGSQPPEVLTARSPMHRLGELRELADAIDFLCSSAAAYVSGAVLPVDGGWGAYSWFYPARDL